jgi:hypothetical protein
LDEAQLDEALLSFLVGTSIDLHARLCPHCSIYPAMVCDRVLLGALAHSTLLSAIVVSVLPALTFLQVYDRLRYVCVLALFVLRTLQRFFSGSVPGSTAGQGRGQGQRFRYVRPLALFVLFVLRNLRCASSTIFLRFCTGIHRWTRTRTARAAIEYPCYSTCPLLSTPVVSHHSRLRRSRLAEWNVSRIPRIPSPVYQQRTAPLQRCLSTPVVSHNPRPPRPHLAQWNAPRISDPGYQPRASGTLPTTPACRAQATNHGLH